MIIDYHFKKPKSRNRETLKVQTEKTIRSLVITLGVMIVFLSVSLFWVNTESASNGSALKQMQNEQELLKEENEKLNTQITNATSLDNIQSNLGVNKIELSDLGHSESYVQGGESAVSYVTEEDNSL